MASFDGRDFAAEPALGPIRGARAPNDGSAAALRWSARALMSIVWISAAIFGLYIIAFYAGAVSDGAPDRWNQALPRLYEPHEMLATIGIGVHFATGTIVLLLG